MPQEKPIFFIHIPKTGGQTLTSRIASAFRPTEVYAFQPEMVNPVDRERLNDMALTHRFVASHIRGELLGDIFAFDIVTCIREPIAQIISNYRHIRREPGLMWHRAAMALSPEAFFDRFGHFLANHQSRYLISAFFPLDEMIRRQGETNAFLTFLQPAVKRVRWLVPTEKINNFALLWQVENRRSMRNPGIAINMASPDLLDTQELHRVIAARPWLYAFDQLLHQMAIERDSTWRKNVESDAINDEWPGNGSEAFRHNSCGIWLTENWYDPESVPQGYAWWAGPRNVSRVRINRGANTKLCFEVTVVNGIAYDDIGCNDVATMAQLDIRRVELAADRSRYEIDIAPLGPTGEVMLHVPICLASIMTTPDDADLNCRSFLASRWSLGC